jgi:hypothetical protein
MLRMVTNLSLSGDVQHAPSAELALDISDSFWWHKASYALRSQGSTRKGAIKVFIKPVSYAPS